MSALVAFFFSLSPPFLSVSVPDLPQSRNSMSDLAQEGKVYGRYPPLSLFSSVCLLYLASAVGDL